MLINLFRSDALPNIIFASLDDKKSVTSIFCMHQKISFLLQSEKQIAFFKKNK